MFRWHRLKRNVFLSLLPIITISTVVGDDNIENLSVCDTSTDNKNSVSSLIYVSTLDGRLSALDLNNNGKRKWILDFDETPLLSSNIHKRELSNEGHWVKLIPSLNGGLFKFDGENVEQLPITTEQLLRSSFRYSDNLVFSGGKETRSYGVSSSTGKILYQCSMKGCKNNTDGDTFLDYDVLIVQRFQQTVRALEPRTGVEKWNYSVGQHELILMPQEKSGCSTPNNVFADIELKVIIPEGLIWAINKNDPDKIIWKYQFNSPIVSVWRDNNEAQNMNDFNDNSNKLQELNLFDRSQWIWGNEYPVSPGLYIGMYERQVYIQENLFSQKSLELSRPIEESKMFPWRPYPVTEKAMVIKPYPNSPENLIEGATDDKVDNDLNMTNDPAVTALSVMYNSGYIDGNGYFLFTKNHREQPKKCNNSTDDDLNSTESKIRIFKNNESLEDSSMQIIIGSVWFWWKEILLILIGTILLNIMLTQHLLTSRKEIKDGFPEPIIVEKYSDQKEFDEKAPGYNNSEINQEFKSQYLSDYEPIDCLGKGGFGVVFEAKKKIDDCHYAIKRIELPDNKNSRDRVMREVKALAKLDHQNIVRYFHAWFECPPAGWQDQHDDIYIGKSDELSPDLTMDNYTNTNTRLESSVCIDVPSSDHCSIESAIEVKEFINDVNTLDDSSYIIFDTSLSGCSNSTEETNDPGDDDPENNYSNVIDNKNNKSFMAENSDSIIFEHSVKQRSFSNSTSSSVHDEKIHLNDNKKIVSNKKCPKMFLYIQMQLCRRLSLREWLKQQSVNRNSDEVLNIFKQIVDAVEYVHLQGLIHRDLKPSNILFAYDDKIKIGDFGLVTAMTEEYQDNNLDNHYFDDNVCVNKKKIKKHTANVGTRLYMSPEQINGVVYDYKVDIYSLGIILFELLAPFVTEMERVTTLGNIKKSIFPQDFSIKHPKEYNLLTMMLDEDPSKRPTTIGIKARPPISSCQIDENNKFHFVMPQTSRHSSTTSNSSNNGSSFETVVSA